MNVPKGMLLFINYAMSGASGCYILHNKIVAKNALAVLCAPAMSRAGSVPTAEHRWLSLWCVVEWGFITIEENEEMKKQRESVERKPTDSPQYVG